MKNKIACIVLIVIGASLGAVAQDPAFPEKDKKVTTVYDDKTNTTVVRFGPMHLKNFTTNSPGVLIFR